MSLVLLLLAILVLILVLVLLLFGLGVLQHMPLDDGSSRILQNLFEYKLHYSDLRLQ